MSHAKFGLQQCSYRLNKVWTACIPAQNESELSPKRSVRSLSYFMINKYNLSNSKQACISPFFLAFLIGETPL